MTGIVQKRKARLQCRQGASVWQPYRDLAKLLRKGTVQSDTASPFFRAVPVLVLAATVAAAALVPVLWTPAAADAPLGDAILLVALLALARFLLAVGRARRRRRIRRHGRLARDDRRPAGRARAHAGRLLGRGPGRDHRPRRCSRRGARPMALSWTAPDLLALFAMLVLTLAETGRIPVDNPDTHLELTMLHEGMLLEHSGPGLACILLATHVKQLVILCLVAALFLPLGLARAWGPAELSLALAAFALKVLALAGFLVLVESSYAKLRFFRVPQFLGLGFVCAFLALALRVL